MDKSANLCNDTHLLFYHIGNRILQSTIISRSNNDYKVFISNIILVLSDSSKFLVILRKNNFLYLCVLQWRLIRVKNSYYSKLVCFFLSLCLMMNVQLYDVSFRVTNIIDLKILKYDNNDEIYENVKNFRFLGPYLKPQFLSLLIYS